MTIVRILAVMGVLLCGVLHGGTLSAEEPPILPGNAAGGPQSTSFSHDSRLLVTAATGDNSLAGLTVYDVQTRAVIQSLPLPGGGGRPFLCYQISFSADGKLLAACSETSTELFLWDTTNWERKTLALPEKRKGGAHALVLSEDGNKLAVSFGGRDDQAICVLNRSGKLIVQLDLSGFCRSLRFADQDKSLVCAVQKPIQKRKELDALCVQTWSLAEPRKTGERENLVQWDMPRLRSLAEDGAGVGVHKFVLSPDGSAIAASAWRDVSAFSLSSGRGGNLGTHELNVTALAISADNKVLASGGHWSGGIWLWDLAGGRRQQKLMFTPQPPDRARQIDPTWERGTCRTVALSPDGQHAAATTWGGKDNSIFLWKIKP